MLPGLDANVLKREFGKLVLRSGSVSKAGDNLAGALNDKRSTVAMTATTSPIWTGGTGKIIDGTGTPTITNFPAAPQAGSQREIYLAAGTVITNGGNISVQGSANYTSIAGDKIIVMATTTTTFEVRISRFSGGPANGAFLRTTAFASSGTWTKGAGTTKVRVRVWGGGGGGGAGKAAGPESAGGGGGGGYSEKIIDVSAITSVTVTVGAAGTAPTSGSGNSGGTGGTSIFVGHCQATGGGSNGSASGAYNSQGGAPGLGSGGDVNMAGSRGGSNMTSAVGGMGGAAANGGGGGGNGVNGSYGPTAGGFPGGGGGGEGGAISTSIGGAGLVIVDEYA